MPALIKERVLVRVSYDDMEAYLTLPEPGAEEGEYTVSILMEALGDKGINTGIDQARLSRIVAGRMYNEEILIARGRKPVDGVDGYYDYNFNTNLDRKPKLLPDGSVDYWSVNSIEPVVAGQVIAIYHPAIEGQDGVTVKGKAVIAKKGREQLPIKGKGFERMNDNLTYTASIDGKIEKQNDRIVILPVHEIFGNAEVANGNINFRGDVIIHGNVESSVAIKATGNITIDGVAEACELEAGKDIILRSGMLGGNKGTVKTKGNITAKFFEFTSIDCEGTIQADVLMECTVRCQGKVVVDGPRGSVIGGEVSAVRGIEVSALGNDAEKKTEVFVGAGLEVYSRLRVLEKKIQATRENLEKIEGGLRQFEMLEKERGVSYAKDARRLSLPRTKIKDTATLASDEAEAKKLKFLADAAQGACVSVYGAVYPGVIINIDDMKFTLKNMGRAVEFYKMPDKISTRPCSRGVD